MKIKAPPYWSSIDDLLQQIQDEKRAIRKKEISLEEARVQVKYNGHALAAIGQKITLLRLMRIMPTAKLSLRTGKA